MSPLSRSSLNLLITKKPPFVTSNDSELPEKFVSIPRGGADTVEKESKDLIEISANVLIQLFGLNSAFHGIILACVPSIGKNLLGSNVDDDPHSSYAEECIGVFALEHGITGYLAATGLVEPEKAIGYGMLVDLAFLTKNLVNGKFAEFGVQKVIAPLTVVGAAGTYAIFADKLHAGPILEILTIVPAIQGVMKYFDPARSAKKMMGCDLSAKPATKALYKHSGQMKIVSAVLRGAIAFGVAPLKALGYSLFVDAVLVADSIFISKTAKDVGNDKAVPHQIISLALDLIMGTVFVFKSEE